MAPVTLPNLKDSQSREELEELRKKIDAQATQQNKNQGTGVPAQEASITNVSKDKLPESQFQKDTQATSHSSANESTHKYNGASTTHQFLVYCRGTPNAMLSTPNKLSHTDLLIAGAMVISSFLIYWGVTKMF